MNPAIYAVVLLLATAVFVTVGYEISNRVSATPITSQQQSSISSQSSSTSDSVIITENNGGESTSSNSIVTSTSNNNLQIDRQSSGKIASSRLNLATGEVEAVLFGNWSLNDTSGFVTNFIYRPLNGSDSIQYEMSGLEVQSVNRINDDLVLAGTIDVISNGRTLLQDTPVTVMIQNGILVVGFENKADIADLFGEIPILGFEQ